MITDWIDDKGYELSTHEKQAEFDRKRNLPHNVTEVFNTGTEAYYKVKYDFAPLIEKWKNE